MLFVILAVARTRDRDGRIPKCGLGWGTPSALVGEEYIGASVSAPKTVGFPGGMYDMSLLVKYEQCCSSFMVQ